MQDLAQTILHLTEDELLDIVYDWGLWSRPTQRPPEGDWSTWLILAGRGFGKTRTGAEWIRGNVTSGTMGRIALVAQDAGDARDVMVEGESGILATADPRFRPMYEPSKRRVTWPNGARATLFSDEDFEALRGPQHDGAWIDELAKFRNQSATWSNLMFGLRLGKRPRCLVTTTPRPTKLMKAIMRDPHTVITRGSTYENRSNLAPSFFEQIITKYEGTRLGRQELMAEVLDDMPGALWSLGLIEMHRVSPSDIQLSMFDRIVVAVDPAAKSRGSSDEELEGSNTARTGIIVAGVRRHPDGRYHGYVLADLSFRGKPQEWATRAVIAYREYGADRIVAEVNNGGDMVEAVIRNVDDNVAYSAVHASRGKKARAEPVSACYEQGRIHHVGVFKELEDEMCTYDPLVASESPDRMDALVWAFTELMDLGVIVNHDQPDVIGELQTSTDWQGSSVLSTYSDGVWASYG